ncbi:hypothetical protein ABFX02_13G035100 [Erythranthe guttata]
MGMATIIAVVTCIYICLQFNLSYSSPPLLTGVHPLDENYYGAAVIKCKDGSRSFTSDRLNDNFCDCADGTDEPGTPACPSGRFYCRNTGSTPRFLFSSRVNDHICDCCDGSDEYDGNVFCPNTCIMGGGIVYQRTNYDSSVTSLRKNKSGIKIDDSAPKLKGLKALVFLQAALVIIVVSFLLFRRRKIRRRSSR